MKEASFYISSQNNAVICNLCPHCCTIQEDKYGICNVRVNRKGKLFSENYGRPCSLSVDPIEKKPLYHFYPAKSILSVGSVGCNLKCQFCQNWEISTKSIQDSNLTTYSPTEIVEQAKKANNNIGIAYTYNEPIIWYEYMLETAKLAHREGLKNVMVSNGFINKAPLLELVDYIDAFNIDLKAFNNEFYTKQTFSKLEPVLETLILLKEKNKNFEITNLIIPTLNDNVSEFEMMIDWIHGNLGENTVLHLSKYFPRYKMHIPEGNNQQMIDLYNLAKKKLNFVYLGNMHTSTGQNTNCPSCKQLLIERNYYTTKIKGLSEDGECLNCNYQLILH